MLSIILAVAGLFATDGSLVDNGWVCVREQASDSFTVKNGELTLVCSPNPYKGACYRLPLGSLPERGELSFEVQPCLPGSAYSNRLFLQVCCGSMMLSFASDNLMRYFPAPKPNWMTAAKHRIRHGEWNRVLVRWDNARRTVKYYVGDMRIPSCVEENATIGFDERKTAYTLRIGNYGLAEGFQTHRLRNLELRAVDDACVERIERDTALVFRGLCSEYFPISVWTRGFPEDKIVDFFLEFKSYNYTTKNASSLTAYPDDDLCRAAKLIILSDIPLEKETISYAAQENLLDAVRGGARMVVTGGLAGLQRCGDFDAPIAKALPVRLESPWKVPEGERLVCDFGNGKISVVPAVNQRQ